MNTNTKRTRPFVGYAWDDKGAFRQYFRAVNPTQEKFGHIYLAIIGPFRTAKAAKICAKYGGNNPHMQSVYDAERLAKLRDDWDVSDIKPATFRD